MKRKSNTLVAIAIVVGELASVGLATTSASAQDTAQQRREIKRQQQLILQQQSEILSNQRRLEGQKAQIVERSPVTGEPIDEQKLPKGLLSGVIPSCPLGFIYNLFTGCVLYVAH